MLLQISCKRPIYRPPIATYIHHLLYRSLPISSIITHSQKVVENTYDLYLISYTTAQFITLNKINKNFTSIIQWNLSTWCTIMTYPEEFSQYEHYKFQMQNSKVNTVNLKRRPWKQRNVATLLISTDSTLAIMVAWLVGNRHRLKTPSTELHNYLSYS